MVNIDRDQYLVAYPDNINELKVMPIKKKDVQGYVGDFCAEEKELLGKTTMPRRL